MLKKILFTFLTLLVIYSTSVVAYRIFEPRDNQYITDTSSYLAYDSLKSYVESSSQNIHFFMFYSAINNDSIYLKNTVFTNVEQDIGESLSNFIEIVDITDLDEKMETKRLSEDWQVSSYPALIAVTSNEDGSIQVTSKLEWTSKNSITAKDVENWLKENGLYTK